MSLLGKLLCFRNIRVLRPFAATCKQQNQQVSLLLQINPITRSVIDAQFADTFANRFHISEVAQRETADADLNASPSLLIAQFTKPVGEDFGLANLDHM